MIFKKKKLIIRHQYTLVELLVVLVITGLLTGMTVSGIKGALARQGAVGAVRSLALKLSLAQSFAVSKNRYVALLVPDYDGVTIAPAEGLYSISAHTEASDWNNYSSCFVKNRICYVKKNTAGADPVYEFERWVRGYEWQTLPSKTVAFITSQRDADESTPVQVTGVPDPTHPFDPPAVKNSTALVFKPSGSMVNANQVVIRVFRAAYLPGNSSTNFYWQGTEDENKGWKIVVNGFTGRTQFCLGGEKVEN